MLLEENLYTVFSKCMFLLEYVSFLDHVLIKEGIMVDPTKVGPICDWVRPNSPIEI